MDDTCCKLYYERTNYSSCWTTCIYTVSDGSFDKSYGYPIKESVNLSSYKCGRDVSLDICAEGVKAIESFDENDQYRLEYSCKGAILLQSEDYGKDQSTLVKGGGLVVRYTPMPEEPTPVKHCRTTLYSQRDCDQGLSVEDDESASRVWLEGHKELDVLPGFNNVLV